MSKTSPSDRRQFLTSLSGQRQDVSFNGNGGYWIRVHRRAMACRFEITLAAEDAGFLPAARAALDESIGWKTS